VNPDLHLIQDNYFRALDRIAVAAKAGGGSPDKIRLVVVSKGQSTEMIRIAMEAGIKIFGENYTKEAVEKMETLGFPIDVEWHMIGHVQSRKVNLAARHFQFLHSLDSLKLARQMDHSCGEEGKKLPVLLEINVGGEASKKGWIADHESKWPDMLEDLGKLRELSNLFVNGLMCMPPLTDQAESSRPYFIQTRKLQEFLKDQLPDLQWTELSMGTSLDYDIAVEEGATLVRVGTAILGSRR
jgi:hypothetical protein